MIIREIYISVTFEEEPFFSGGSGTLFWLMPCKHYDSSFKKRSFGMLGECVSSTEKALSIDMDA
jgi:hypothetical protein